MWLVARRRAAKLGIPFSIEPSDITIPDTCPMLGIPIKRSVGHKSANSPSLDKKIPSLGYVKGNVWVISDKANTMKQDATPEQLVTFAKNALALVSSLGDK
jgi:hypothetical protein